MQIAFLFADTLHVIPQMDLLGFLVLLTVDKY